MEGMKLKKECRNVSELMIPSPISPPGETVEWNHEKALAGLQNFKNHPKFFWFGKKVGDRLHMKFALVTSYFLKGERLFRDSR